MLCGIIPFVEIMPVCCADGFLCRGTGMTKKRIVIVGIALQKREDLGFAVSFSPDISQAAGCAQHRALASGGWPVCAPVNSYNKRFITASFITVF